MKTFHRMCMMVFAIAIINLLLFAFVGLIIGGDALSGKIEDGHYYLANHGQLTEVNYFVFMYSKIHAYSILVTHPAAMLAGFLYWVTGGGSIRPKSQAAETSHSANNIFTAIKSLFWKITDLIEEIFWVILVSWRKPDYELFIRLSKQECIKELHTAIDNEPSLYNLKTPLWGFFSGNHFYIKKWKYNPNPRSGSINLVLSGRFSSTPQGTYIRMWHGFTAIGVFFITLWLGTILSALSLYIVATTISSTYLEVNLNFAILITSIFYISIMFISIRVGSFWGKAINFDIIEFIKNVLDHHHTSSQLAGFRLARKMQGKL